MDKKIKLVHKLYLLEIFAEGENGKNELTEEGEKRLKDIQKELINLK